MKKLLLAMLSVAISFAVVLSAAFWLARQNPAVAANAGIFGAVVAFAIAFTAAFIARALGIPGKSTKRPRRNPALPLSPEMKSLTPELQREYNNDRSVTITCPHLEPVESAMRRDAITVTPIARNSVKASCRIYLPNLEKEFAPLDPVRYLEYFIAERSPEDTPVAELRCAQCGSRIDTYHPFLTSFNTTWFPAPPPSLTLLAKHLLPGAPTVTAIARSHSGRLAAVAAGTDQQPQQVAIWEASSGERVVELPPHGVIRGLAWGPEDDTLVTARGIRWQGGKGSPGPSIYVWNARTGSELLRFDPDSFGVRGIALSPDGKLLLASTMLGETAAEGSAVDLWDLANGRHLKRFAEVQANGAAYLPVFSGVAFSPDASLAVAGCGMYVIPPALRSKSPVDLPPWWNRGIRAWKLPTGEEVEIAGQLRPANEIAFSADGSRLFYSGGRYGVWAFAQNGSLWDVQNSFAATAASPGLELIARGRGYRVDSHGPYDDTGLELLDGSTGRLLAIARHQTPVLALAFTDDVIVAGGEQGELRFWRR